MENNPKSTTGAKGSGPASTLANWARQGMESFVATQKILLDLVAQQNSLALGFVRERVNFSPLRPLTGMVELTGQGITNFVAAQKILLDLAAEENALVLCGVKDGLGLSGTAAAMTDAVRDGVKAFVGMQKKFLDMVDEQTKAAVGALTEGKPYEGKSLAEVTRQGLENFISTQKKFLDLVTEATQPQVPSRVRSAGPLLRSSCFPSVVKSTSRNAEKSGRAWFAALRQSGTYEDQTRFRPRGQVACP